MKKQRNGHPALRRTLALAGWSGLPSSALSAATVLTIQDNALLLENRRAIQSSAARTPSGPPIK